MKAKTAHERVAPLEKSETGVTQGLSRWIVIGVFGLASMLNYLDRQLLAAAAPAIKAEFSLSNTAYGTLLSAFSITYMIVTPLAGLFIDYIGVRVGAMIAVTAWSITGGITGFVRSFTGLFMARMGLGIAEAAGIPASSKASATYLRPSEVGLGNAIQSIDITVGAIAAPLVMAAVMPAYGWRAAFIICGALGLLWVPLWRLTSSRAIPSGGTPVSSATVSVIDILVDKRLWGVVIGSTLVMTVYSLWMNWTTIYLVQEHGLTQTDANRYFAWIPPIFASVGGIVGGWWAYRLIRRGNAPVKGRLKVCLAAAPILAITAIVPYLPTTQLAVAGICASFFGCMTIVINLHVIPIDLFGAKRAAFTASLLTASFALVQTFLSPTIGAIVDYSSFATVCLLMSVLSLGGVALIWMSMKA